MHTNNPFAQGGWYNPENPNSINTPSWSTPPIRQPSVFGALPSLDAPFAEMGPITFRLAPSYPDILNCSLFTPRGEPYLEIVTDHHSSRVCTYFRKRDGTLLAFIEWEQQATITISGIISKEPVNQWLALSPDKMRRMMFVKNRPFTWVPQANQITLFAVGSVIQHPIGTISRQTNCVTLQLTSEAMQAGLLESSIVATVLLQSGRLG
ncbi:hypothetical protein BDZ97DRAFT_1754819 [Flammula alnicola]|nr:hypothetical protein BDZ97DRAFT_1754819 [Flammula alnicola]